MAAFTRAVAFLRLPLGLKATSIGLIRHISTAEPILKENTEYRDKQPESPSEPGTSFDTLREFEFGSSDFTVVSKNAAAFVDRSIFIKRIVENPKDPVITAPRRSGKSTNLHMLKLFLDIPVDENGRKMNPHDKNNYSSSKTYMLFKKLAIFKETEFFEREFGMYPVIHLNFANVGRDCLTKKDLMKTFSEAVSDTFRQHIYLLEDMVDAAFTQSRFKLIFSTEEFNKVLKKEIDTSNELGSMLKWLVSVLRLRFGRKVYVLVDEYDAPLSNIIFENLDIKTVNVVTSAVLTPILKDCHDVINTVHTGICYMKGLGSSSIANLEHYPFFKGEPYREFLCLSEDQVLELLRSRKLECQRHLGILKVYCNGYMATNGTMSYNILSVRKYLQGQTIEPHWIQSGHAESLEKVLKNRKFQSILDTLLNNESVQIVIPKRLQTRHLSVLREFALNPTATVSMNTLHLVLANLLDLGYLTCAEAAERIGFGESYRIKVKIPNKEVKDHINECLVTYRVQSNFFSQSSIVAVINSFEQLAASHVDVKVCETLAEALVTFYSPYFKENDKSWHSEASFHQPLTYILKNCLNDVEPEIYTPDRKGIVDISIRISNIGVAAEMKYERPGSPHTSESALKQGVNKKYETVFDEYPEITYKIILGICIHEVGKVSISAVHGSGPFNDINDCLTVSASVRN